MRLGIRSSVDAGPLEALNEAHRLGCDALQLFTHSPRLWHGEPIKPVDAEAFKERRAKFKLDPLLVHAPYLLNLSAADETLYARSYRAFLEDLKTCRLLGVDYLVVHPGAYSENSNRGAGIHRLAQALTRALEAVPGEVTVLVENMAGGERRLGARFEDLEEILWLIKDKKRIGVCLDTAHTLAGGYAFSTPEDAAATLKHFDKVVGLSRLRALHANDSKAIRGSHLDLHEHIGRGHIGLAVFHHLLHDPRLHDIPAILETPKEPASADRRNLWVLSRLRERDILPVAWTHKALKL